jgi:hypothetical protein
MVRWWVVLKFKPFSVFSWVITVMLFPNDRIFHILNEKASSAAYHMIGWLVYSLYSHLEHRASVKSFVSLQFPNLRHSVGLPRDQPAARPLHNIKTK